MFWLFFSLSLASNTDMKIVDAQVIDKTSKLSKTWFLCRTLYIVWKIFFLVIWKHQIQFQGPTISHKTTNDCNANINSNFCFLFIRHNKHGFTHLVKTFKIFQDHTVYGNQWAVSIALYLISSLLLMRKVYARDVMYIVYQTPRTPQFKMARWKKGNFEHHS